LLDFCFKERGKGDLLVNHVHDPVGDYQVWFYDFGGIDVYVSVLKRYCEIRSLLCLQIHSIRQHGAVVDGSGDDVVLKYLFQLSSRGVLRECCGACKCCCGVWNEVCHIRHLEDLVHVGRACAEIIVDVQDGNEVLERRIGDLKDGCDGD